MTIAAKQLRTHLLTQFPGIRISRNACRYTASGGITQHSAYGGPEPYDSNALDIMGGPIGWNRAQNLVLIQQVVDYVTPRRGDWSINKILWQVADHYGHAHLDFYPRIISPARWCGGPETPTWAYSYDATIKTRNPEPENGRYNGDIDMTYAELRAAEFDMWTDENIIENFDRGRFQDKNRSAFIEYWVTDRAHRTVDEKARFITDYYAHL